MQPTIVENTFFKGNRKANIIDNVKSASITALVIYILGISFWIAGAKQSLSAKDFIENFFVTIFFTFPLFFANSITFDWIEYKLNLDWKNPVKRIIIGLLCSAFVSTIISIILMIIFGMWQGNTFYKVINWLFSEQSIPVIQRIIWISLSVATVFYVINYVKFAQKKKLSTQKEKVVQISVENEALKAQIGPHFLFNSLNVLNGLIAENQDKAQEFVSELSMIYRYVLEQKEKQLVKLSDELNFGKTYLNLVQKRFEEGLQFSIEIPENISQLYIVPLSLQILLENCVKHNVISSEKPLKIQLFIQDDFLIISNSLARKKLLEASTKTGLQNIINRYAKLSAKKIEIVETENQFTVKLPLFKENSIEEMKQLKFTETEYYEAREIVKNKKEFFINLASYCIIIPFLFWINWQNSNTYFWAKWPAMGWGIGLLFQAIKTFGFFNSKSWEEKQIQKEIEKRRQQRERLMK